MKFCPKCGRQLQEGSDTCYYCQTKIDTQETANQQQVAAPVVESVADVAAEPKKSKKLAVIIPIVSVLLVAAVFAVLVFTHVICLSHSYEDATCTDPKTCVYCSATEGEAKGHKWEDATCLAPKTCKVCDKTIGDIGDHAAGDWTIETEPTIAVEGTEVQKCTICEDELDEREVEKLTPTVVDGGFNCKDDDFIAYMIDTGLVTRMTKNDSNEDDEFNIYTMTWFDGTRLTVGLSHVDKKKDNNVAMIMIMGDDIAGVGANALSIAEEFDTSVETSEAAYYIVREIPYNSDDIKIHVYEDDDDAGTYFAVVEVRK